MEKPQAVEIIQQLADGVHPVTGELFPNHSPYQNPVIVRALFLALAALKSGPKGSRKENLPSNTGKPWSEEEDRKLLDRFDAGKSIEELAAAHQRTQGGIQARLVKHERIPPPEFRKPRESPF
jgi:hypothetical protein